MFLTCEQVASLNALMHEHAAQDATLAYSGTGTSVVVCELFDCQDERVCIARITDLGTTRVTFDEARLG